MTRTFSLTGSIFALIVLGASAQAACGGGGYKVSKKSDAPPVQASSSTVEVRRNSSDGRRNSNEVLIRRLNMSEFEQIRAQLKLTEKQSTDIKDLEADIKRKGDEAIAQVKSYDGKQDFDERLPAILTPDQVKVYQSTKVAHR